MKWRDEGNKSLEDGREFRKFTREKRMSRGKEAPTVILI